MSVHRQFRRLVLVPLRRLMAERATSRIRSRRIWGFLAVAVIAGLAATVVGAWVDWTWPNPVYGMHVIAMGVALLFVLVGVAVLRRGTIGESIAAASFGALFGVVIGMTAFGSPYPQFSTGTIRLTLEQPVATTLSGEVACVVDWDRRSAWAFFGQSPVDGFGFLTFGVEHGHPPEDELLARADGRRLWISLEYRARDDGDDGPGGVYRSTTQDTVLTGHMGPEGGSLRFARLQAGWDGPSEPDDPAASTLIGRAFAGSVEWACGPG